MCVCVKRKVSFKLNAPETRKTEALTNKTNNERVDVFITVNHL